MRTAAHRHHLDRARDVGLDQRPHAESRHGDGVFRDKGETEARQHHALHPVVAIGAEHGRHLGALLAPQPAGMAQEFALTAIDIGLAVELADPHRILLFEAVAGTDADHEALVVEAPRVEAFVDLLGLAVDGHVELAPGQPLAQLFGRAVLHRQPHLGMALAETLQEWHEAVRPDGAHHAELELDILQAAEALGPLLGGVSLDQHLAQVRPHHLAQPGQMGVVALAAEQRPAQLVLQCLDGAGQRRLRDVARLGRPREVQGLADRKEVADLMHFHGGSPPQAAAYCPRR